MNNFIPFLVAWGALTLVVIFLAVYRKSLSGKEDDTLHLNNMGTGAVAAQESLAAKLAMIDKWGKLLTIVSVVAGIALAGWYIYYVWTDAGRMITQ